MIVNNHLNIFFSILGKKIYRIKATIDCSADKLITALENDTDITKWNTTLTNHQLLKEFDNGVKISYQVTTEAGPGGVVSARDFILIHKKGRKDNEWMSGGCSVNYPGPENSKFVRAWNGPTGELVRPADDPNKVNVLL